MGREVVKFTGFRAAQARFPPHLRFPSPPRPWAWVCPRGTVMTPSSQGAVRVRSGRSQGHFHSVRGRAEPGKRESPPIVFTGQTDSKSRPAPSARYLEGERHPPQQREGFFSVPVHDVLGQDGAACKRRERWPSSAPRERGACPGAGGAGHARPSPCSSSSRTPRDRRSSRARPTLCIFCSRLMAGTRSRRERSQLRVRSSTVRLRSGTLSHENPRQVNVPQGPPT